MRSYWFKITLGALVIFAVGITGVTLARRIKYTVQSSSDLTVPLRFVPFKLDGQRMGTFRKLVIHRQRPDMVDGVDLTVLLDDPLSADRFGTCSLTVENPTQINERTTFTCVQPDSGLAGFGHVYLEVRGDRGHPRTHLVAPLLLTHRAIRELQGGRAGKVAGQAAAAEDGSAMADSINQEVSRQVREATRGAEEAARRAQDGAKKAGSHPPPRPPGSN